MRKIFAVLAVAMMVGDAPVVAQDARIPQPEQDADRVEAQALYDQQKQRDQVEADRVAKINLDRQSDYDLYLAKQKAEYDAKMAQWRADVARQEADYADRVARCKAGERAACAPR